MEILKASQNRLQFVRHEEVFETKEKAIEFVESIEYGKGYNIRPSKYGEPIVLKYGDEENPKLLLGIGLVDGNENPNSSKTFWIDMANIDEAISEIKERLDKNEDDIADLKELFGNVIDSCGFEEDGSFVLPEGFLDEESETVKDCLKALSDYILKVEKASQLVTEDTDTIDFDTTVDENGRVIKANVKLPTEALINGKTYENQIIVGGIGEDKGVFNNVDLSYNGNGDTLKLIVNGEVKGEYEIPSETHVTGGKYRTEDEKLVLTLNDESSVEIDLYELASEIRPDEESNTPIQLRLERVVSANKNKYGDSVWYSLLSADVYVAENTPSNILEKTPIQVVEDGKVKQVNALFVKGTADNIKFGDSNVEEALKTILGTGEGSISGTVKKEQDRAEGVEALLAEKLQKVVDELSTTNDYLKTEAIIRKESDDKLSKLIDKTSGYSDSISAKTEANEQLIKDVDKKHTLYWTEPHSRNMAFEIEENKNGTFINGYVKVATREDNIIKGGNNTLGPELYATAKLGYSPKMNAITFETTRQDDSAGQIYYLNNAKLTYSQKENSLHFTSNNGEETTLKLKDFGDLVDKIYYDPTTEEIVIEYIPGDETKTESLRIPVRDLIEEWHVEDTDTVKLTKIIHTGTTTTDALVADVKVAEKASNILEIDGANGLYVSNSAITSNTKDIETLSGRVGANETSIVTINDKLDVINGNEAVEGSLANTLKQAKDYTDQKIKDNTLSGSSTIDITDNVVSVKVCEHTDVNKYLKVHGTDGLSVEGVDEAIESAVSGATKDINSVIESLSGTCDEKFETKADSEQGDKDTLDSAKEYSDSLKLTGSDNIKVTYGTDKNVVELKINNDLNTEGYLKTNENGIYVSGIDAAIKETDDKAEQNKADIADIKDNIIPAAKQEAVDEATSYTDTKIDDILPRIEANETAINVLNDTEDVVGSVKNTVWKAIDSVKLSDSNTISVDYASKKAEVKVHDDELNKYLEKDKNGLYVGSKVDTAIESATSGLSQTLEGCVNDIKVKQHTDNTLVYDIVYYLNDNTVITAGTINIPKDQFLKEVKYENNILTLVFVTEDGEKSVNIDLKDLIDIYTAGDGLQVTDNKFSIKINKDEKYLEATADGLRTKGIDKAISDAVSTLEDKVDGNYDELTGKTSELEGKIGEKQNKLIAGDAIKLIGDIIDVKLDVTHSEPYLQIHQDGGLCLTGITAIDTKVDSVSGAAHTEIENAVSALTKVDEAISAKTVENRTLIDTINNTTIPDVIKETKDYADNKKTEAITEAISESKTYTDSQIETVRQEIKAEELNGSETIEISDKVVSVKYNQTDKYLKVGTYGLETQGIDDAIASAVSDAEGRLNESIKTEKETRSGETSYLSGQVKTLNQTIVEKADKDSVYTKTEVDDKLKPIEDTANEALDIAKETKLKYQWKVVDTSTVDLEQTESTNSGFTLSANVKKSLANNNAIKVNDDGLYVGLSELTYSEAGNELTFTDANGNKTVITLNAIDVIENIYFDGETDELVFQYTVEGAKKETRINAAKFFKGIYGTRIDDKGNATNITVATALTTNETSTVTGISANLDVVDVIKNDDAHNIELEKASATDNRIVANLDVNKLVATGTTYTTHVQVEFRKTANNTIEGYVGISERTDNALVADNDGLLFVSNNAKDYICVYSGETMTVQDALGKIQNQIDNIDNLYKILGIEHDDISFERFLRNTNYLQDKDTAVQIFVTLDEELKDTNDRLDKEIADRIEGDKKLNERIDNLQSDIDVEDTKSVDLTITSKTVKSGDKTIIKADVKLSESTDTSGDDGKVNLLEIKDDGLFFNGSIDYGTF